MSFEIPKEEVERMKPEGFTGTYTYSNFYDWIQHNERVDKGGDLRGLKVWKDGTVWWDVGWHYPSRNGGSKHYRTLEDLVQDCDDEELLALFLKEHCQ